MNNTITATITVYTASGKIWVSDYIPNLTAEEFQLIVSRTEKIHISREFSMPYEGQKVSFNPAFIEAITVKKVHNI